MKVPSACGWPSECAQLSLTTGKFSGTAKALVDVSDIFYFFPLGEGKGESEAPGGGGARFFNGKSQEGGGGGRLRVGGRGGARGREGVCREFGGGGAKSFFSGPKFPPRSGSAMEGVGEN